MFNICHTLEICKIHMWSNIISIYSKPLKGYPSIGYLMFPVSLLLITCCSLLFFSFIKSKLGCDATFLNKHKERRSLQGTSPLQLLRWALMCSWGIGRRRQMSFQDEKDEPWLVANSSPTIKMFISICLFEGWGWGVGCPTSLGCPKSNFEQHLSVLAPLPPSQFPIFPCRLSFLFAMQMREWVFVDLCVGVRV